VLVAIAVLCAVALPSFVSVARRSREDSEVYALFNDLITRMEQHNQEHGDYPATLGETSLHPIGAPSQTTLPLNPLSAAWSSLKIRVTGNDHVRCGYTWVTGHADDNSNVGPRAFSLAFQVPATNWYYLIAECSTGFYFTSSANHAVRKGP
jgi:type II secretory pathway pseudopilin PulG